MITRQSLQIGICEGLIEMDLIKLYEADRMEEGKKIEDQGIKERDEFLGNYHFECNPILKLDKYLSGWR